MDILVVGLGLSGESMLKLAAQNNSNVFAYDDNSSKYPHLIENGYQCLQPNELDLILPKINLVLLSPGISLDHLLMQKVRNLKIKILGEIEFAFQHLKQIQRKINYNPKIIAITGTNGKTTTTMMISHLLRTKKEQVFTGGNIGVPFCELFLLKNFEQYTYIVLELSSFQLEGITEFHADVAIITNITMAHTERYQKIEDYQAAKERIYLNQNQSDILIYPKNLKLNLKNIPSIKFQFESSEVFSLKSKYPKIAKYNYGFWEDTLIATICLEKLNKIFTSDEMGDALNDFNHPQHRMEEIENDQILFINNSKSTNFESTEIALANLPSKVDLILGGKLRDHLQHQGQSLKKFKDKINQIFLIGDARFYLYETLYKDFDIHQTKNLDEVFEIIRFRDNPYPILLSPCYPSFDQFKNYEDRGNQFKKKILDLKNLFN